MPYTYDKSLGLHENLLRAGVSKNDIDHHRTDLYVKKTELSTHVISQYEYQNNVTEFVNAQDALGKERWYDIPFAWFGDEFDRKY